jgi:hypothetical protein
MAMEAAMSNYTVAMHLRCMVVVHDAAGEHDFRTDEQRAAVNAVWVVEFRRVKP